MTCNNLRFSASQCFPSKKQLDNILPVPSLKPKTLKMTDYNNLKGLRHSEQLVVEHKDTAAVYGSGALEVFATPAMIALMEKTCLMSVCDKIGEGNTTVGIAVNIKHLKASPVGSTIRCETELVEVDRRRLVFAVKCYEGENLIGEGIHERFVVESAKFMAKL